MKVIVVGAGIGGLTAHLACNWAGFAVEHYERQPHLGPAGAGIVLWRKWQGQQESPTWSARATGPVRVRVGAELSRGVGPYCSMERRQPHGVRDLSAVLIGVPLRPRSAVNRQAGAFRCRANRPPGRNRKRNLARGWPPSARGPAPLTGRTARSGPSP